MPNQHLHEYNLERSRADISRRIRAFADRQPARTCAPPALSADAEAIVPEVQGSQLSPAVLRDNVNRYGILLVRGLLSNERCEEYRGAIDAALDAYDPEYGSDNEWYAPPTALGEVAKADDLAFSRAFHHDLGSIMCADTPGIATSLLECYDQLGLKQLVEEYLEEEPCISVKKWVLRRIGTSVAENGWHQDGAFMGTDISSLNMWISLSHCGAESGAPGMDLFPQRLNALVSSEGAHFDWSVSKDAVPDLQRGVASVCPEFRPGDAVFFDHFHLHRTQYRRDFTRQRYAIETWFFGGESFPKNQIPMAW